MDVASAKELAELCGQFDSHLHQIENRLNVKIQHRGSQFFISGDEKIIKITIDVLQSLHSDLCHEHKITPESVHLTIQQFHSPDDNTQANSGMEAPPLLIRTKKNTVKPRGKNQQNYVRAILTHDINFGVGPAGTGKLIWPLLVLCKRLSMMK